MQFYIAKCALSLYNIHEERKGRKPAVPIQTKWQCTQGAVHADRISYECPREQNFSVHTHTRFELLYVVSGDVSYELNGDIRALSPGDLILIAPGVAHCLHIRRSVPYERIDLIVAAEPIEALLPGGSGIVHFGAAEAHFCLFARMETYRKCFSDVPFSHLLEALAREILLCAAHVHNALTLPTTDPLTRALSYIDTHLSAIEGVEQICRHLYITKSHLHHLFRTRLRTSPKQYILTRRLALARRLMHDGVRAGEAAHLCGFGDYTSFFRAYKKSFGCAPTQRPQQDAGENAT